VRGTSLALLLIVAPSKVMAQGTIVFVRPSQPIYCSDVSPSGNIDINNDGVADFTLSGGQDVDLNPLNNNAVISVPEPPGELGAFIYAFSQGAPISSSVAPVLVWWASGGNAPPTIVSATSFGALGYFAYRTDPTYAGIRLHVGGALYYGWIHVENLYGSNWGQSVEKDQSLPFNSFFAALPRCVHLWLTPFSGLTRASVHLDFRLRTMRKRRSGGRSGGFGSGEVWGISSASPWMARVSTTSMFAGQ
jgi:hypothetical protein